MDKDESKKVSNQSAVDSRKTDTTDGDTEFGASFQTDQGVADNGNAGGSSGTGGTPVLASILCNEMLNLEIELASNEKKLIVPQLIVVEAAELELLLEISDEIWVTLVADQVTHVITCIQVSHHRSLTSHSLIPKSIQF